MSISSCTCSASWAATETKSDGYRQAKKGPGTKPWPLFYVIDIAKQRLSTIKDNEKDILINLPYYQTLYEEGCITRSKKNTGKKRTEETKKKMSNWQKGKPKPEAARRNMSKAQKGRHRSQEEILHWKESMANKSDEEKQEIAKKISEKTKGRVVSEEEKAHRSAALKGKSKSAKHKKHLSEIAKNRIGEKSSNAKLREEDVIDILMLLKNNIIMKDIIGEE